MILRTLIRSGVLRCRAAVTMSASAKRTKMSGSDDKTDRLVWVDLEVNKTFLHCMHVRDMANILPSAYFCRPWLSSIIFRVPKRSMDKCDIELFGPSVRGPHCWAVSYRAQHCLAALPLTKYQIKNLNKYGKHCTDKLSAEVIGLLSDEHMQMPPRALSDFGFGYTQML